MALTINTNLFALNAQRNLRKTETPLTTAMQRLSSGLRINSAKDDAAGLAIATRMTRQVNGLSVAMRNANDGLSIAQTAEGAIEEMTSALQRMNELAEQAASYNTNLDRQSLNSEVSQLIDELSRIVNQTRYNGEKMLAGGFSADIQVGVEVNETINVSLSNLSPTTMGVATDYNTVTALSDADYAARAEVMMVASNALAATDTINGVQIGTALPAGTTSQNKVSAINAQTAAHGVTAFTYGNFSVSAATASTAATDTFAAGELVINGIQISASTGASQVANINAKSGETGVTAALGAGGNLVLFNKSGAAITVSVNSAGAAAATGFAVGTTSVGAGSNGLIVLNQNLGNGTVTFNNTTTGANITGVANASETTADAPVNAMTVNTAAAANLSLLAFKSAMDSINTQRAVLGAKLNRFESVIRNLDNVRENITAARSRIMDADFATETTNLTKALIVQQAGISVLSQANTLPQNVLSLLGGR